jgi:hypothetical protein
VPGNKESEKFISIYSFLFLTQKSKMNFSTF